MHALLASKRGSNFSISPIYPPDEFDRATLTLIIFIGKDRELDWRFFELAAAGFLLT